MTHQIVERLWQRWSSQRRTLLTLVGAALVLTSVQTACATQPPQADRQPASGGSVRPAQLSAEELDQLVAPIALYPDALVAQVLAAATYPTEVVQADRWMQQNSNLTADALAKAVDQQPWDPSVKALTQFPSVLEMMDKNLSWTSSLGEAYGNNQAVVLDAVQQMRLKAQQAGNLKSTPQQTVTTQEQTIVIEPASPEVVYVPQYDPWLIYGAPLAFYPGWLGVPGVYAPAPGIFFGGGIGIGVFGGFGWGWHHWDADWHHHFVDFDHHHFISHSPTFGHFRPVGGPGAFGHPGGFHPGGFPHSGAFQPGEIGHAGGFHSGGFVHPGGSRAAVHSSAFSGFNHGGVASAFSSRGRASFGGSLHGGGFHGGGFHGGGFHAGGGHR